jgi:hydrogenase maturation protease
MSCAATADRLVGPGAPEVPARPRWLVVGVGNPLLGDDGVGWRVVDVVQSQLADRIGRGEIEIDHLATGGLDLMERLLGAEQAILVDATVTGSPPGTLSAGPVEALAPRTAHLDTSHEATFHAALDAGRALGADLPERITVVGIEAARLDVFDDRLTPEVAAAVDRAVTAVIRELERAARPTPGRARARSPGG